MCEEFRYMYNIGATVNFCVVHRMVLSNRTLLVCCCTLLTIDNGEREVWNVKAMNLRTGSGSIGVCRWNCSTQKNTRYFQ